MMPPRINLQEYEHTDELFAMYLATIALAEIVVGLLNCEATAKAEASDTLASASYYRSDRAWLADRLHQMAYDYEANK